MKKKKRADQANVAVMQTCFEKNKTNKIAQTRVNEPLRSERQSHSARQTQMTEDTCVPSRTQKTLISLNLTFRWNEQGRAGVSAIRVPAKEEHGKS